MKIEKVITLMLVFVMVLSIMSIMSYTASAATDSGICGDNLMWTLYDDGELVISGSGAMTDWSLVNYAPWYNVRDNIKTVTINAGVTTIGNYAFYYCDSLTSITIPDGVTIIGDYAFEDCTNLTSITIPDSVTSMGSKVFCDCTNLTSITIPDSVTSIEYCAFMSCDNLASITIPDSITTIEEGAFISCSSLTSIEIPKSVTKIGESVFDGCSSLTSITIPDGITTIEKYVFTRCSSLTSITIPDSVTSIGYFAFAACNRLTDIYFNGTSSQWSSISIDGTNTVLNNATIHCKEEIAAGNCGDNITWILYDDGELVISGSGAMTEWSSEKYVPWYNYTYISSYGSYIKTITIGNGVTSIGDYAFAGCNGLTDIDMPDSINNIGIYAFENCINLTSITIPDSVTTIEKCAFSGCNGITSITIPRSVQNIGKYAFSMDNLIDINVISSNSYYKSIDGVLFNKSGQLLIEYARGRTDKLYSIPSGVTNIGDSAFASCDNLTGITIPNSVTIIEYQAFRKCEYLTDIVIPDSVTNIENSAFEGCEALSSITIPDGVTSIKDSTFRYCYGLTDIVIPDSVTSIAGNAFDGCRSLTSITIPNSVTSIGGNVFQNCTGLTSITIPNSVTSIASGAFYNCTGLTDVYYNGTSSQWGNISIGGSNTALTDATIHYTYITPTSVSLDKSALNITEGESITLTATVLPSNATNKAVTWSSSNANVATVSNGTVTAKSAGSTVITVTTEDGGKTASCIVTVTAREIDKTAPRISISEIKVRPGHEATLTIDLANNTGFVALGIEVGYDKDVMTLISAEDNTGVGGSFTPAQTLDVNPYNMSWDGARNILYNGNLATLTFKINVNAHDGIYPITLDYYKGVSGDYIDGDSINYDEDFEAVGFVYVNGGVIVANYIPGDINGDETINNKDATFLLRYLAGWSIELVEDALDVDGSSAINNKDATILLRYLAGWDVTLH